MQIHLHYLIDQASAYDKIWALMFLMFRCSKMFVCMHHLEVPDFYSVLVLEGCRYSNWSIVRQFP